VVCFACAVTGDGDGAGALATTGVPASTGAAERLVAVRRKIAQGNAESFVLVGIMGFKPSSSTAIGSSASLYLIVRSGYSPMHTMSSKPGSPQPPGRERTRSAFFSPPVLTATGKIVSDHKVQVVTKVSGQIVALFFEQGDRVEKDQLLARIEDVTYRARRDEAAAQLAKSRARLEYQKISFVRTERLYQQGSAPDIEYADAKRGLKEAEAQVAAEEAALEYGQKLLDYCEVTAPIAGVVLERNVEVGDVVAAEGGRGANANAQFASIADMSKLRVEVDISELDIDRIRQVKSCTIVPDAYKDRRYEGHVLWIDPGADYSKATVQVKVRIKDPDDRLRVEGSAQVTFLPEVETAVAATQTGPILWIPASACLPDPSGQTATVFMALDGRLRRSTVSIGRRVGGQVEVTQGLREGQSIAADGLANLADGQRLPS